jgi:Na+/H+-dicarboxylate symporter
MMRACGGLEGREPSTPGGFDEVQESLLAFAANLPASAPMKWLKILYVQVLIGIVLGVLLGLFYPETGTTLQAAGGDLHQGDQDAHRADHFLHGRVAGIASMGDLKRVGRVGLEGADLF